MNLEQTVDWLRARGEPDDVAVYLAIAIRAMFLAERAAGRARS